MMTFIRRARSENACCLPLTFGTGQDGHEIRSFDED
jgi:hypothetical protein